MDIMLILQIIVLLGGIYLGVRLGGMGVGYAGGLGVVVLAILGMKVDMKDIPMDVILIIALGCFVSGGHHRQPDICGFRCDDGRLRASWR